MTRRRTNTNGHQFVNALVAKDTYDFLAHYRGVFSFGVGLDNLVAEVRQLRQQAEMLRKSCAQCPVPSAHKSSG